MNTPNPVRLGALSLLLVAAAACDDQDDAPTGAGNDLEIDAATVQEQAISTFDFVNGLVDGIDEMAAADFSGVAGDLGLPEGGTLRQDAAAVWDAVQGAWVVDVEGTESDENGSASYDVYFLVRFRDAGGLSQQNPDSTTVSMQLLLDYFVDAHAEDQGSTLDLVLDFSLDILVAGLPAGPYTLDGEGDMGVTLALSGGESEGQIALAMSWTAALSVPVAGGCPSGTAGVTVEDWRVDAVYDGQGGYDWQLFEGAVLVDQSHELVACAPAS
jgi:hypothetical protein